MQDHGLFQAICRQKIGVQVNDFGIKKMKTRWGTCNPEAQRIWTS